MNISELKSNDSKPPSEQEMLLTNLPLELAFTTVGTAFALAILATSKDTILFTAYGSLALISLLGWRCLQWRQLVAEAEELSVGAIASTLSQGLVLSGGLSGTLCGLAVWFSSGDIITSIVCAWVGLSCVVVPALFFGRRQLGLSFVAASSLPLLVVLLAEGSALSGKLAFVLSLLVGFGFLFSRRLNISVSGLRLASMERDSLVRELEAAHNEMNQLKATTRTATEGQDTLAAKLAANESELKFARGKAQALTSILSRVNAYDNESGLLNAKKFKRVLSREWARMERGSLLISLIYIEIDDFHRFRETYGQAAYESALSRLAGMIAELGRRPGDVAGRLTEVSFAVLLPEADEYSAEAIARRFAEAVRALDIDNIGAVPDGKLSISAGVTSAIPMRRLSIEKFLGRADEALANAKTSRGLKVSAVRYIQRTRVEYWNEAEDGIFSPEIVLPQLSSWGYSSRARTVSPDDQYPPEIIATDTIDTVLQGQLAVTVDGVDYLLTTGDRLYLPAKAKVRMRAKEGKSVVLLEAERYKVALVA